MKAKNDQPKNWDQFDMEAERQSVAIRAANVARAKPYGNGKKLGHHLSRV
jgi:hypothetical protein